MYLGLEPSTLLTERYIERIVQKRFRLNEARRFMECQRVDRTVRWS